MGARWCGTVAPGPGHGAAIEDGEGIVAKYWTSLRTGTTYDVTSRDAHGNWAVVSTPFFGSLTVLAGQAAAFGGLSIILAGFIGFAVSFVFVGITMAIARWFICPLALFLVCLGLLALPEGRRRWVLLAGTALFCLFFLFPMTFVSMYLLGQGYYDIGHQYAWVASVPFVPVMFLIMTVWLMICRAWWVAVLSLFMACMTGLMSLISWADTLASRNEITGATPPAAGSMAMDNVLSVLTYGVVFVILSVLARQISVSMERRQLPTVPNTGTVNSASVG